MSRPFSVVKTCLRAKSPQTIYIDYHAHELNLVIVSCVESVGTVGSFFSLFQPLYTFILNSTQYELFVEAKKAATNLYQR